MRRVAAATGGPVGYGWSIHSTAPSTSCTGCPRWPSRSPSGTRASPLVGVIIDVARNDEFVAIAGEGATLNGETITVSTTPTLDLSLVSTGFPYDRRQHAGAYLRVVEEVMLRSQGTRRLGAAALDLAWLAAGRYDAYWEHGGTQGIKPWDVAAGILIVTEAGGTYTNESGETNQLEARAHVASNGRVHEELRSIVARTMPEHLR